LVCTCLKVQKKEKFKLTDCIKEYNIIVNQLNKNINTLRTLNKRQGETIKQLKRELSEIKKEGSPNNLWAELKEGRDT
jgi:predicted RNase H-like nuclease (RuvC/YqgF family)